MDLVRSIPISDENYEAAIQALKQRYDNKILVIQSHIRSILDSPRIDEVSAETLHKQHSHICTHVDALKAAGQPVEHWNAWLVTIITSRLGKITRHGWQLHLRNTELPKYEDIERFLASRCVALESSESFPQVSWRMQPCTSMINTKISSKAIAIKKSLFVAEKIEELCICCGESHKVYTCEKFKKMTVNERLAIVHDARNCFNCLSSNHGVINYKSRFSCQYCKIRHNALLHFDRQQEEQKGMIDPNNWTRIICCLPLES